MSHGNLETAQLVVLLLLAFVVVFALIARRLETPYPIVLVLAGLLLGFVPGIPRVTLDPQLIFFVVLPPLLFAAAWVTPWRAFWRNVVSIAFLAVGLVAFTAVGVALFADWAFDAFDWRLGFVLGAVVAPTDAVAATAIANRVGLPRRIVELLEGESLLNDATGLLALDLGLALVADGHAAPTAFALRFAWLTAGGIGVGAALGFVVAKFERWIDDGPIEIAISLLVPYAAYFAADRLHASGILAVVTSGLYLGHRSSGFFSASVRLQAKAVWNALDFILNGFVFVLIGLQLPQVLSGIKGMKAGALLLDAALLGATVIALRLLWSYPGSAIAHAIRGALRGRPDPQLPPREIFVVGWTGMRGVIALAAALSIPHALPDGTPFPRRSLIVFLSFAVIVFTLVVQGLTLPALIRALGLAGGERAPVEEDQARALVVESALRHLEHARKDAGPDGQVFEDLANHYRRRLSALREREGEGPRHGARYREISQELLRVEREEALRLRDQRRIDDDVLRTIEHELDLREARLQLAPGATS